MATFALGRLAAGAARAPAAAAAARGLRRPGVAPLALGARAVPTSPQDSWTILRQRRTGVFSAVRPADQQRVQELHREVAERFSKLAHGRPRQISTAQLVQILLEAGLSDSKSPDPTEVLNTLMLHGFYRKTHSQKKDSYGPPDLPTIGLEESQRWATLLFLQRMKKLHLASSQAQAVALAELSGAPAPPAPGPRGVEKPTQQGCENHWCMCGFSLTGIRQCVLAEKTWEKAGAAMPTPP